MGRPMTEVMRAKRQEMQEKRLAQMLDEFESGNKTLNMHAHAKRFD
jgi:hypothetical protein